MTINPLLKLQYEEEEKQMHYNHENCFTTYIASVLDHHGLSYVWKTQVSLGHDNQIRKSLAKEIKTRLTDMSSQTLFDHLHNISHQLNFLSESKQTFQIENYLKINHFESRRDITKLRTSSHRLLIETSRWENIVRNLRLCKNCSQREMENEEYFLFHCQLI